MAFNWRKFPWTNLHDLNLDWIIQTVKTLADAVSTFPEMINKAITSTLTGSGDLTISKTGDVNITGNNVQITSGGHAQMIGGAFISDTSEQLTLHNPNSRTNMTANYNNGVLTLTNNQQLANGVAVYPINTPADGGGDNSTFAANVGYVKDAVNAVDSKIDTTIDSKLDTAITKFLTGDGNLTIDKRGDVGIYGYNISLTGIGGGLTIGKTGDVSITGKNVLHLHSTQGEAAGLALDAVITPADSEGDNSDFAANVGYVKDAVNRIVTETTEVLPAYTNQIPLSTDASGAVLNGVGYERGTLDTDGAVVDDPAFVSGFIPVTKGDIIRIKDPSSADFSTDLVFAMYKSDKATGSNIGRYIHTMQSNAAYGSISISGNVLTWDTSNISYYFWDDFAYFRVTTNSANSIVTINQEIVETTQTINTLNPNIKVREENLDFDIGKPLLSGRKVVVFGDSIIGMSRDQTSVPACAAAYTGAEVYNVGFGGCRMSVHPTVGYAAFSMWALADAVASGDYSSQDEQAPSGADYFPEQLALLKSINFNDVDMIVIHYGTNDFAANVTINNTSDDDDTATLCGALRYSLRKLMTAFPKIRIFVSVPIYRKWGDTGAETYTNSNGKKLQDFCEALAGVASEFNLPVIDGYKSLGVNTINDAAFSSDGTHLNQHGRRAFGELIGGKLISPA